MKQRALGYWIIPTLLLLAALKPAGDAAVISALDDPKATLERFVQAFNDLDWSAFRDCFADDASLFNPDIPEAISLHRLDGRAEVERSFRAVFTAAADGGVGSRPHIAPENVRIQRFNEIAIATFEFRRGDNSFGRRTVVLNRQHNAWLIVHIHASNVTRTPNNRWRGP